MPQKRSSVNILQVIPGNTLIDNFFNVLFGFFFFCSFFNIICVSCSLPAKMVSDVFA